MYNDETYGKIPEGMTDSSDSSSTTAPDSVTASDSGNTTAPGNTPLPDNTGSTYGGNPAGNTSGTYGTNPSTGAYGSNTSSDTYRAGSTGAYNPGAATGTYTAGSASGRRVHREKKSGGFWKKLLTAFACALVFGVVAGVIIFSIIKIGNKILSNVDIKTSHSFETFDPFDDDDDFPRIESTKPIGDGDDKEDKKDRDDEDSNKSEIASTDTVNPGHSHEGVEVVDVSSIVEENLPCIVAITSKSVQYYQSFWGMPQQFESQASGSGVIVGQNDEELLIVTNSHVIADAEELIVKFNDGESYDAMVKGSDSKEDIAVIAVSLKDMSDDTISSVKIAMLGDSDSLELGEPAIVVGNSLGYGTTVTYGIISALNRDFKDPDTGITRPLIQTDAAINPGNSGGALFNYRGEVVGITEAKIVATSTEGVGYAIPISTAEPVIDDLSEKNTKSKPKDEDAGFLGVSGVDVADQMAEVYDMPVGVYVAKVSSGSAADKGGIKKGDIITDFDGESISSMDELMRAVASYPAGTEVEVKIQRMGQDGYEEKVIQVTLGSRAEMEQEQEQEQESGRD